MPNPRTPPITAFFTAIQFLTRIPTPPLVFTDRSLPDAVPYFPVVGLLLGIPAAFIQQQFAAHLSPVASAFCTIAFLILATGALHEDGLADVADAFGSHHSLDRTLEILRDSRIGTYGALALILSVAARILLLAAIPRDRATPVLIAALTLSRWSALPLSLLPPARPAFGQGIRIAQRLTPLALTSGTLSAILIAAVALRLHFILPIIAATAVTALTALVYKRRINGITGDCFGCTSQLVEVAVLFCGAWGGGAWVK